VRLTIARPAVLIVALVSTLLSPATAARAQATYPTVSITSPTDGSTVEGVVGITISAAVDPAGTDYPATIWATLDGQPLATSSYHGCSNPLGAKTCTLTLDWDAIGLTGSHTLTATTYTGNGGSATSQPVSVHVQSPPPTATITSPSAGDQVAGQVLVQARGDIDAAMEGDAAKDMTLLVDGAAVDSAPCTPGNDPHSCPYALGWDSSQAATGLHTLQTLFSTTHGQTATSPTVTVTLVDPPQPVVSVTSPTAGTSLSGAIAVTATGSVDGSLGDFPVGMGLVVDDVAVGDLVPCPQAASSCALSLPWDGPTLGAHRLAVVLVTDQSFAVSDPVDVVVVVDPPTATLKSPVEGATVSDFFATTIGRGSTDPRSADLPRSLQLVVDGVPYGSPTSCSFSAGDAHVCTLALGWDTSTATPGPHVLQVRLTTETTSTVSVPATVTVPSPTAQPLALTLDTTYALKRGGTAKVTGHVVNAVTRAPVPRITVGVTFTPAAGPAVTVDAVSGPGGAFVAVDPTPVATTTKVLARPVLVATPSSASAVVPVLAPITCTVPAKARHRHGAKMSCHVPYLPDGTVLKLYYQGRGQHLLGSARAKNGTASFTATFTKPWQYPVQVWAVAPDSSVYAASISAVYKVRVS
jgi:Bacterial Ig domain